VDPCASGGGSGGRKLAPGLGPGVGAVVVLAGCPLRSGATSVAGENGVHVRCECGRDHRVNQGVRYYGEGKCLVLIRCDCGRDHVLSRRSERQIWQPPKLTPLINSQEIADLFKE
jgi:hypothetical protein